MLDKIRARENLLRFYFITVEEKERKRVSVSDLQIPRDFTCEIVPRESWKGEKSFLFISNLEYKEKRRYRKVAAFQLYEVMF